MVRIGSWGCMGVFRELIRRIRRVRREGRALVHERKEGKSETGTTGEERALAASLEEKWPAGFYRQKEEALTGTLSVANNIDHLYMKRSVAESIRIKENTYAYG